MALARDLDPSASASVSAASTRSEKSRVGTRFVHSTWPISEPVQ